MEAKIVLRTTASAPIPLNCNHRRGQTAQRADRDHVSEADGRNRDREKVSVRGKGSNRVAGWFGPVHEQVTEQVQGREQNSQRKPRSSSPPLLKSPFQQQQ